jgi:predicted nucleotidyltransferase
MTLPLAVEQEIVRRLRPLNPAKVILFGSYAKGTATEESDIDLAVVVPSKAFASFDERMNVSRPIFRALRTLREIYAMDILVCPSEEYQYMKSLRQPFWREIETTGRVLYGKQ